MLFFKTCSEHIQYGKGSFHFSGWCLISVDDIALDCWLENSFIFGHILVRGVCRQLFLRGV